MTGALPVDVRLQVAFGAAPSAPTPTWTTITDWVIASPTGASLSVLASRSATSPGLSGRVLETRLDNRDGRFDPSNTSSPYHPGVRPLVPIRLQVLISGVWYDLYRGVVTGWPVDRGAARNTVLVRAVDALGWAAMARLPATAFDAEVAAQRAAGRALRLWAVANDSGWRCRVTGHALPATSRLVRDDSRSLIDGEPGSWVTDGVSAGVSTSSTIPHPTSSELWSWWQMIEPRDVFPVTPWSAERGGNRTTVSILSDGRLSVVTEAGEIRTPPVTGGSPELASGGLVHIAVWRASPLSSSQVWVNGARVTTEVTGSAAAGTVQELRINGLTGALTANRWVGAVDHLQFWQASTLTVAEALAKGLWSAGRLARAGDRLDERARWLAGTVGWQLVAPDDPSTGDRMGVVTRQGFRGGGTLMGELARIEDTEQGMVWVDNSGRVRLFGRSWPSVVSGSSAPFLVFDDTGSGLPFDASSSVIVQDDQIIVNRAEVTSTWGTQQIAEDAASIAAFGVRQVSLSDLLHASDRESVSIAEWMVLRRAQPTPRVEKLVFSAMHEPQPTMAVAAVEARPGLMISVTRDGVETRGHILGVQHEIGLTRWDVTLATTPVRLNDVSGMRWDYTPWDNDAGTVPAARPWVF